MIADLVFAHGLGGGRDLPIPTEYAIAGAGAALAVSFIVLALAWRTSRFDAATKGRPVPAGVASFIDSPALAWILRGLGLAFALYVGWAALAGPDVVVNPFFGVVYVLLWVGLVPASFLFGPVYRAVNPVRTLHLLLSKATGLDPRAGLVRLPSWVGIWPAALGLFAFVWLELVHTRSTYLMDLRLWMAIYIAIVFIGAAIFGDRWIESADPFEVFSTLVGRLCVIGRTAEGRLVLRSPLGNLDGTPPLNGTVAAVAVLFGSTAYDSFRESPRWVQVLQTGEIGPIPGFGTFSVDGLSRPELNTLCLVAFVLVVLGTFGLATLFTGVHEGFSRWRLPNLFAHSVVPIIIGYFVAHYLSYFVTIGQVTVKQLSDPMVRGDNYLGTANWEVNSWLLLHPTLLAVIKVVAIVTGHLVGVVAAHDRAVKLLPKRHQLTGQLPLLVVMVFYTVSGLYLLLSS
ncbi:MAG TPA: hypothetical protein VLI04_04750 [Nocardioidaceae bacterium]|nr:hypothetical protein [Nocardioidaceae bacterium]